jgi:hypothetical protein
MLFSPLREFIPDFTGVCIWNSICHQQVSLSLKIELAFLASTVHSVKQIIVETSHHISKLTMLPKLHCGGSVPTYTRQSMTVSSFLTPMLQTS